MWFLGRGRGNWEGSWGGGFLRVLEGYSLGTCCLFFFGPISSAPDCFLSRIFVSRIHVSVQKSSHSSSVGWSGMVGVGR